MPAVQCASLQQRRPRDLIQACWYEHWHRIGDRAVRLADSDVATRRSRSRARKYLRAANYYLMAERMMTNESRLTAAPFGCMGCRPGTTWRCRHRPARTTSSPAMTSIPIASGSWASRWPSTTSQASSRTWSRRGPLGSELPGPVGVRRQRRRRPCDPGGGGSALHPRRRGRQGRGCAAGGARRGSPAGSGRAGAADLRAGDQCKHARAQDLPERRLGRPTQPGRRRHVGRGLHLRLARRAAVARARSGGAEAS
jgi:hypothetical protein